MNTRWILVLLAAASTAALPTTLRAQGMYWPDIFSTAKQPPATDPQYDEITPGQAQRAQEPERSTGSTGATRRSAAPKPAQPSRTIACSGAFAKDSNHLKLASAFKSDNVAFTEVDAPEGKKLMASVLFPKDPKRRIEVWWANEAERSGIHLIVINGQSTWAAPKGLRLGMQFAALERLNGKPFKLKGFDKDDVGMVSDWQGGTLDNLPGNCRVGVSLRPDARSSREARAAMSGDKEFVSSDASARAVRATVSEILIGY